MIQIALVEFKTGHKIEKQQFFVNIDWRFRSFGQKFDFLH